MAGKGWATRFLARLRFRRGAQADASEFTTGVLGQLGASARALFEWRAVRLFSPCPGCNAAPAPVWNLAREEGFELTLQVPLPPTGGAPRGHPRLAYPRPGSLRRADAVQQSFTSGAGNSPRASPTPCAKQCPHQL